MLIVVLFYANFTEYTFGKRKSCLFRLRQNLNHTYGSEDLNLITITESRLEHILKRLITYSSENRHLRVYIHYTVCISPKDSVLRQLNFIIEA